MVAQIRVLSSDISHMPLHAVWRHSGVTQRYGFELEVHIANVEAANQPFIPMRERGRLLLAGEYQFLSGLHHEPYVYRAKGDKRFTYLAQAQNAWDDRIIVKPGIRRPQDLEGAHVIVSTKAPCVFGNVKKVLATVGVNTERVGFDVWEAVGADVARRASDAVIQERADAAVVDIPFDRYGKRHGLGVLDLPEVAVIHNVTVNVSTDWMNENPELTDAYLRSMIEAIHFFKTRPDDTCEILAEHVAPMIGIDDEDDVKHLQTTWSRLLSPRPFPHPLAIWNVYALDVATDPDVNMVGPLEPWDTGWLKRIDDSGFIDRLYGEQSSVTAGEVPPIIHLP